MPPAAPVRVDASAPDSEAEALTVVGAVLAAARAADGRDAIDEAAVRRLRHGLAGTTLWLAGADGFAWRHDDEVDLVVRPGARGVGTGTALAHAAAADPHAGRAWSHTDDPAARRIAARLGWAGDRALWVMRRGLAGDPALPPLVVPAGVAIRGYRAADAGDVVRVNAAAFATHPEQGRMDAADLAERVAQPWFDPAGLLIAVDTRSGDVLGFHWTKRHSPTLGEVYVVGIAPEAQGRGLGTVLTLAGLHHLADGGASEVLLYVEADNAAARAVYARLGFTHAAADTHVQYVRVGGQAAGE